MNNIFSFERFLKVLKYDLKMRVPAIWTTFLVLLVMPHALHFLMDFDGSFRESLRIEVIGTMLFILTFWGPFSIYSAFREKHGIGSFLMIPASALEKFASMVVICFILLPVAFCACSFVVDSLFAIVFKDIYGGFISLSSVNGEFEIGRVLLSIFSLVGVALLGNVVFKKRASAKTILCILGLTFLSGIGFTGHFSNIVMEEGNVDALVLQEKAEQILHAVQIIAALIIAGIYALTYWRIKKIQIS